jgi:hypothetical protein
MPRRLINLEILEVSSVPAGAGRGVTVELVKRQTGVSEMNLQQIIAKSFALRAEGKISDYTLAIAHQERAKELGIPLAKYYDSDEGKKALKAATSSAYFESQTLGSSGNGYPGLDEVRNEMRKARPKVEMASPAERARKCAGKIAAYQKAGMTYDQAASKAHRDEQQEALAAEHAAQWLNSGPQAIDGLGDRVNISAPEATERRPTGIGTHR